MTFPVFEHMDSARCTGCEACASVCATSAIRMSEDAEGFRYPVVDEKRCVHCQRCVKTCPALSETHPKPTQSVAESQRKTIAGYAKEEADVAASSSGGFFGLIAKAFLKADGIVAGVTWTKDFKSARHICVESAEKLPLIQRSKYVQSEKDEIYHEVQHYLKAGRRVLFVGCPCEAAALDAFLPSADKAKLYIIDLVCQGPASTRAMREFSSWLEEKRHTHIRDINMRYAIGPWIPQYIRVEFEKGRPYLERLYDTALGDAIRVMQRPSCYQCPFAGDNRKADLTLGDYHGADPKASYYHESGVSIAIAHTPKGKELLSCLTDDIAYTEEADYLKLSEHNQRLIKPWPPLPQREIFSKAFQAGGLRNASRAILSSKGALLRKLPTKLRLRVLKALEQRAKPLSAELQRRQSTQEICGDTRSGNTDCIPLNKEETAVRKLLMYGGSGIISSEITNLALRQGYDITLVNRGRRKEFMPAQAKSIVADMRAEPLETLRQKLCGQYDAVFDFLSYTLPELKKNMELARGKCRQYLFISSATVYNTKEGRYSESDPIGQSTWDYAVNKASCEKYLAENAREYGFQYTIIRPYITYGITRIPLQFAPLEYYSVIHRMKCGKCVPVFDGQVPCTLTFSKDFAVAAVGLILNEKAYGEAFHITGAYETTWNDALKLEASAFGQTCDMVPVPLTALRNASLTRGLHPEEVIADKSRSMLFNNQKVRDAVPAFTGETKLEDALGEIAAYFGQNPSARRINYAWDGRVDHMLIQAGLVTKEQKKKLRFSPGEGCTAHDRLTYLMNRSEALYMLSRLAGKIQRKLRHR